MCFVKVARYSTLKPEPSSSVALSSLPLSLLPWTTFQIYKNIKPGLLQQFAPYSDIIVTSASGQFVGILGMEVDGINWLLVVPVDLEGFGFHFWEIGRLFVGPGPNRCETFCRKGSRYGKGIFIKLNYNQLR